jgi:hypothetical protein
MAEAGAASRPRLQLRPVLLAWLFLSLGFTAPYAKAWLLPPPGQSFQGAFFFVDDHFLYLSYAQQAEDGAFFFHNKLVSEDHAPGLVNLEWWAVGRISALLGRRPFLAYRMFAWLAALLLLGGVDAWLRRCGLPATHRLPALLLVAVGGSFGGLLYLAGALPVRRALDMATGIFPAVGLLANPHFTAGTALLLWALLGLASASWRSRAAGLALGSVLGLVRPYDFVLLALVRVGAVTLTRPWRAWLREALPLAGLLPVVAFSYWAYYRNPAFAFYAQAPYAFPDGFALLLALAPAAAVATFALGRPALDAGQRDARAHLLAWLAVVGLVIVLRPVPFSLQFLAGTGVPLLAFGALGLAARRPAATWMAAGALGTTTVVALTLVLLPLPYWFTAAERVDATEALRPLCRPGDLAFAPPDIGLRVGGLTACRPWASHMSHPEFPSRSRAVADFYDAMAPADRRALLDRACIRLLVLPGDAGTDASAWLGSESAFRRAALVGSPPRAVSLYSRGPGAPCMAAPAP